MIEKRMIVCDCDIKMSNIMGFSQDKHEKFSKCPKYCSETRHQKLRDNELDFGEVLSKEIHNKRK